VSSPRPPLFILDSREQWRPEPVEASLNAYGYHWIDGEWVRDGKPVRVIDLPPDIPPGIGLPVVGYYRVVKGSPLHWHQYWSWWRYNAKTYAGTGAHEGDWEFVQIGCRPDGVPVLMSCSQHDGGQKREYWGVTLTPDGRPIVYVARDSHANYFNPTRDVTDIADGAGEHIDPTWLAFGAWQDWLGVWGHSRTSPGPLSTRRAWNAPHAWHRQCRD
jgi:hypothetical protein